MRNHERTRGLLRTPRLLVDVLAKGRYDFIYDRMPITVDGMNLAKRLNLLLAGTHLVRRQLRPWNMPLHMQFELTSYCNLKCPVCPTGTKELEREAIPMPPALFERAWEETAPYLLTASLWGWGEPLLHPELGQILRIARRHNVATLLSTNGMPLRRESVREALVEHPPLSLIVAIDGITDETNSRYRVGAKLEPILSGVRKLAELKRRRKAKYPVLQLRYIVMSHNEHEVGQLEAFAKEHEFELLTLRSISIFDTENADAVQSGFVPLNELLQPYRYKEGQRQSRAGFICTMPFWFPSLQADGGVVSCEQDHGGKHRFGILDETGSFRRIWFSEQAAQVRKLIRDEHEKVSFCRNCPYADLQTADCSLESSQLVADSVYPGLVTGGVK
jgi:radical SAM protein with 4Fe4S-binding SPASM domain